MIPCVGVIIMLVFNRERLQPTGKEATATVNGRADGTKRETIGMVEETIGMVEDGKVQTALDIGVVGNEPVSFRSAILATTGILRGWCCLGTGLYA